jgi:hypothetical protein
MTTQVLLAASIVLALSKLDPANDQHWTAGGLPRLDIVKEFAKESSLIREQLELAAPGFSRTNLVLPEAAASAPAPEAPTEPRESEPPAETENEAGGEAQLQTVQTEQPKVDDGPLEPENEIQALEAELEEIKHAVDAAAAVYAEAQRHYLAVQAKQDALIQKRNAAIPPNENGILIRDYLTAQESRRAQGMRAPIDQRSKR